MQSFLTTCVLLALLGGLAANAEPLRHVLLDTAGDVRVANFSLSSGDVPGSGGPWSIRSETLHGGTQEAVDLVTIDAGGLVIRVIPPRGMSVLDVRRGDFRTPRRGEICECRQLQNPLFSTDSGSKPHIFLWGEVASISGNPGIIAFETEVSGLEMHVPNDMGVSR